MSASTPPPHDAAGAAGNPDSTAPGEPPRRGAARVRLDADFELMLALRGAARARDLRNRVVRPRVVETRDVAGSTDGAASTDTTSAGSPAVAPNAGGPRDVAHPEGRSG